MRGSLREIGPQRPGERARINAIDERYGSLWPQTEGPYMRASTIFQILSICFFSFSLNFGDVVDSVKIREMIMRHLSISTRLTSVLFLCITTERPRARGLPPAELN